MNITRKSDVEVITLIVMLGFCLAELVNLFFAIHQGHPPVDYFLATQKKGAFGDFYAVYDSAKTLAPYSGVWFAGDYFPFTYLFMVPFTWIKRNVVITYYHVIAFTCFAIFNWVLYAKNPGQMLKPADKTLELTRNIRNVFALSFLTYPALWVFISGNVDFYLFLFLAGFIYCYTNKKYMTSTLFLSCAIAMKAYPGVFIFLLLSDKKYKEAFVTCVVTLAISLFALLLFKTSIHDSLTALGSNLQYMNNYFVQQNRGLTFSTSLFSFLRIMSHAIRHEDYSYMSDISPLKIKLYFILAVGLFSIFVGYLLKFEKEPWKKVMILTFCMILLPQIGFSYKLINVYLPLYVFANSQNNFSPASKMNRVYCIIFGLLLIPKEYTIFAGQSISVVLNPALMLSMIFFVMYERLNFSWAAQFPGYEKAKQLS